MKKALFTLLVFSPAGHCFAQKVKQDSVKTVCTDIPREKRPRLTVARFSLSAPNAPRDQFGDNLATMLTNALQLVNCYNVLSRLKDSSDLMNEQNFQQGNHVNKAKAIKTNKMLGANVIVTGEVVKYEASSKNVGIGIVHTQKSTAAIGINIMLTDPETRLVIDSRVFTAEKKVGGGMNVGMRVPLLGNLNAVSAAMSNPAVQGATEEAINQAVVYISSKRDQIPLPESTMPDNASQTTVSVENIKYEQLSSLAAALEKISGVISVDSDDYTNNNANIEITHTLKPNDLINKILEIKAGVKLNVKSKTKDSVTLTAN